MGIDPASFSSSLIAWQRKHGRNDLPWQGADPYRVWLSEIMLQQTQVSTVIPYYLRFVASFPDIVTLANAEEEAVLAHWSGLGYYARCRNLHRAARAIVDIHDGQFPQQYEQILGLPGIGRSTAAAISAQAFHEKRAILDGNVKRLLARYCGISGETSAKQVENELWRQAEALLPDRDFAVYTQALMDMGATLCTRSNPKCGICPVQKDCIALQSGRVKELPTPKTRKRVPEKRTIFLLVNSGGEILLEKRKPSGIWGGLWCFPEAGEEEFEAHCKGWNIEEQAEWPEFTHTFTHFRLNIRPIYMNLAEKPECEREHTWMSLNDALQAAIPAPVRKLLANFED